MFDFNKTLNPYSYLALFESKSVVIFIYFYCLIISFKLYKIIFQPDTLSFTLCFPESMHSVHWIFHVYMLKPATSNSFLEKVQLALTLVMIDGKPEYEISQIVDSKIDCWWTCKLLYKVIWLGYKDTKDKSKWISISKLAYVSNLVFNFHITYSAKPSPLPLS